MNFTQPWQTVNMRFAPKTTYRSGGSQEVNVYNVRNDNYYITARYELIKVKNKLLGMHYMTCTKCFLFLIKRSTGVSTAQFIFNAICCVIFRPRIKNNSADCQSYIFLKKSINMLQTYCLKLLLSASIFNVIYRSKSTLTSTHKIYTKFKTMSLTRMVQS